MSGGRAAAAGLSRKFGSGFGVPKGWVEAGKLFPTTGLMFAPAGGFPTEMPAFPLLTWSCPASTLFPCAATLDLGSSWCVGLALRAGGE